MERQDDQQTRDVATIILRTAVTGALATLDATGAPFASFVGVATTHAGEPILLLSRLAAHTRNLERDRRASLLLVDDRAATGDPLATGRLTIAGMMSEVDRDPILRRRFLIRHSDAEGYAGFADFGFRRLAVERAHLVAGFGRIAEFTPDDILITGDRCDDLIAGEEAILDWLNSDRADDLAAYLARTDIGRADDGWRATGIDPAGLDLARNGEQARLRFDPIAPTADAARRVLDGMIARQ